MTYFIAVNLNVISILMTSKFMSPTLPSSLNFTLAYHTASWIPPFGCLEILRLKNFFFWKLTFDCSSHPSTLNSQVLESVSLPFSPFHLWIPCTPSPLPWLWLYWNKKHRHLWFILYLISLYYSHQIVLAVLPPNLPSIHLNLTHSLFFPATTIFQTTVILGCSFKITTWYAIFSPHYHPLIYDTTFHPCLNVLLIPLE